MCSLYQEPFLGGGVGYTDSTDFFEKMLIWPRMVGSFNLEIIADAQKKNAIEL